MTLMWIAFASFAYVALRAFQQLNVTGGTYLLVIPTSFMMAIGDIFLITNYAKNGVSFELVAVVGLSSGCGSIFAMWLRQTRWFRVKFAGTR